MNDRAWAEARLVASAFPGLQVRPADGWALIPAFPLAPGIWKADEIEMAFRFPEGLPAQEPYAFWVRPALTLISGAAVQNVTEANTPFGEGWQQFSWSPEAWQPGATPEVGTNMLHFVRSCALRLGQGA